MIAAFKGNPHCVELLLPHCDAKERDDRGMDALMAAAQKGGLRALLVLLPHSDPSAQDNEGRSALAHAARVGNAECVATLLPVSKPNAIDKDGWTALMRAIDGGHPLCSELLLHVSDVRIQGRHGRDAQSLAKNKKMLRLSALIAAELESDREKGLLESELAAGEPPRERRAARL